MSFAKPDKKEPDQGYSLTCSAHGCPLRWSVQIEGALCSYHAWSDPVKWPGISEELRRIGAWRHPKVPESPGVKDMKTRMRSGFSFSSLAGKLAA